MKNSLLVRIVFSLALIYSAAGNALSQNNYNWITPNRTYLKLSVVDDGMYRITRNDFTNAGINTANIDPRTVRVLNRGLEIPIHFEGEQNGTFDSLDYFDFFGTRVYGGPTKYYNENNVVQYTKDEFYTPYSDTNVYWVEWGVSNGLRYSSSSYTSPDQYSPNHYFEKIHSEKDRVYSQGERADANDFRYFNNENFLGEGWYWNVLSNNQNVSDTFTVRTLSPDSLTARLKLFAYPANRSTQINNEHAVMVQVNNVNFITISTNDFRRIDTTMSFPSTVLSSTLINTVRLYYFSNVNFAGQMYIDMFDVFVPRSFRFHSNIMRGTLDNTDTTTKNFRISGFVSTNPVNIYDVANNVRITNYSSSGDTLIFSAKSNASFEIHNRNITRKPFRITQRQVPNLVTNAAGADYLLIYHSLFSAQAQQLKNHRETFDDLRVFNAEIRDIYDVFNFGIENPIAVRNFVKHVYENWTLPRLGYVCLFGRATIDPKKNSSSTVFSQNLIPTYGNPTSDGYFSNFNYGSLNYYNQVAIGRLPAINVTEAQTMVDNIIDYNSKDPELWWKVNTFIVGGGTKNDQNYFNSLISPVINNYAIPPTISADVHRIFRNDTSTSVTFNYKDSIRRDINNGASIVNFLGHAGYENWEEGMQDPATLSNYGKYPLVFSMTCYTGKNADPVSRSFSERWMTLPGRGSAGFVGCTGWGWTISQTNLQSGMYDAISGDTLRRFGDLLKAGKYFIIYDTNSSSARHTINSYNLLGDPASKLNIPEHPEYAISNSDYRLSDNFPEIGKPLTVTVYPKNFGLYSDSCRIRFQLKRNGVSYTPKDTVIRAFRMADSVRYSFTPDSLYDFSLYVTLDVDNRITEENDNNNSLIISIPLKEIALVPLKPVHNSVVPSDTVELAGLNPLNNTRREATTVFIELDTSASFNSPLKKTFARTNISGAVTRFRTPLPLRTPNMLYYWRTNTVINNDSTGWTSANVFTYSPGLYSPEGSRDKGTVYNPQYDTGMVVFQYSKGKQYSSGDFSNTSFGITGASLSPRELLLITRSMGSSGAEASYFSVNDKNINIDGGRTPGLSMVKVRKVDGKIMEYRNIRTTSGQSSDSVVNFLNTFDTTHYLMALNASYVANAVPLNATAKAKIRSFGSTKIDSFSVFGWFDSWSFIGYPGAPQSQVSEVLRKYSVAFGWRDAVSTISSTISSVSGSVSHVIGPVQSWNNFEWKREIFPGSSFAFDVVGIDRNGASSVLLQNQTNNALVDLSGISPVQYPKINLLGKFAIDTITGTRSAVMNSMIARYRLPGELVAMKTSFALFDSVISVGEEAKLDITYENAGFRDIPSVVTNVYHTSVSQQNLLHSDTLKKEIRRDSSRTQTLRFPMPYIRTKGGKTTLITEAVPMGSVNEFYTYNNYVHFLATIVQPGTENAVSIYADGKAVKNGDIVRKNPELRIDISQIESIAGISADTSRLAVYLNSKRINSTAGAKGNSSFRIAENPDAGRDNMPGISIFCNASLSTGDNKLRVIHENAQGDRFENEFSLIVSDVASVKDLVNFPNPMKTFTAFTFTVTGEENPGECRIKIYTASGRLIKEIRHQATVGFNSVEWDGKDSDGDFIANGMYLYRLTFDGDAGNETKAEKLAVLR